MRSVLLILAVAAALPLLACEAIVGGVTIGKDDAGAGGASVTPGQPPPPPTDGAKGTDELVFAIDQLFFGETDRTGKASKTAWESYGYDIDHLDTKCKGDACTPVDCLVAKAAAPDTQQDGTDGIDNAFGHYASPAIPNFAAFAEAGVHQGKYTFLFDLKKAGNGDDYAPFETDLYTSYALEHSPPKRDGSDVWRPDGPRLTMPSSYIANRTWVSGVGRIADLTLVLDLESSAFPLTIHNAVITFTLANNGTEGLDGVIAGVLDKAEFAGWAHRLSSVVLHGCGAAAEDVAKKVSDAADTTADGTQGGSDTPCTGISIGLGFHASRALLGKFDPAAGPKALPNCL